MSTLAEHSAEIASCYGLGTPTGPLVTAARGEQGQVWRLDTDSGSYAVKELFIRQEEPAAAEDVAYQRAVLAACEVQLPAPVVTSTDRVLSEVATHQIRVYEWADLLPFDTTQDPGLIGRTYAAIHRVEHVSGVPLTGWYTDPVGAERWAELLEASYDVGAPFAGLLAREIPHLVELEGLLAEPAALRTCHRDLWSDNLAPLDDGGVCVIDWENSGLADPAQELPMALIDFCWRDPARTVEFYAAYRAAGGPARLTRLGDFTMVIAQFGHFWEAALETYLAPDATAEGKSHSLGRIHPLVAAPLRVEQLEAVLDQVTTVH